MNKENLKEKFQSLTGEAPVETWSNKQLEAEIAKLSGAAVEKTNRMNYFKSAVLQQLPPERSEALTSKEWPNLLGEFIPVASFPYTPTAKHIATATNPEMSEEEKKAVVKELGSDSLVRFKIGGSKEEFILFASILRGAGKKAEIAPFITLPDGRVGIKKGLKCKIQPKKFEFQA